MRRRAPAVVPRPLPAAPTRHPEELPGSPHETAALAGSARDLFTSGSAALQPTAGACLAFPAAEPLPPRSLSADPLPSRSHSASRWAVDRVHGPVSGKARADESEAQKRVCVNSVVHLQEFDERRGLPKNTSEPC